MEKLLAFHHVRPLSINSKTSKEELLPKNACKVLGISRSASIKDVHSAWKELALILHPDKKDIQVKSNATACFQLICRAKESIESYFNKKERPILLKKARKTFNTGDSDA